MRPGVRPRLVLLAVALLAAGGVLSATPLVERTSPAGRTADDVRFVRPAGEGGARLWPYTSRGRTFDRATLPINAVLHDDPTSVYRLLTAAPGDPQSGGARGSEGWRSGDPDQHDVTVDGTGIDWAASGGAARYTFVTTGDDRTWTDATYQVHDGAYFGSRYHLRLYEGGRGAGAWTAVQAHREHWNWFRLRHEVTSLSRARYHLERDLLGTGAVAEMRRERWANGGAVDADGWVTVVELRRQAGPPDRHDPGPRPDRHGAVAPLLAVTAFAAAVATTGREWIERLGKRRRIGHGAALFAATSLLPPGVRVGAIAVERAAPGAEPAVVGGPFYLLLVLGLPGAALLFGRHLRPSEGFALCVLGMGTGLVADYAHLGLTVVSFAALAQQLVLLFGLGLIGAGGARWATRPVARHRYRAVGLAVWVGALLWPLLGLG